MFSLILINYLKCIGTYLIIKTDEESQLYINGCCKRMLVIQRTDKTHTSFLLHAFPQYNHSFLYKFILKDEQTQAKLCKD